MRDWNKEGLRPKTLIELYGNERVLIEEHRGILGYGDDAIRVGTSFGALVVEGTELRLCCMSRSQLVIRGRIACVRTEVGC
ncbi:MAG: YabP/YqfC family sporulation protein [Oscillospiraceae bacterium]|nr:YabP/YqfC family sporulation protein [Oscillospiraceae bacterium]